MKPAAQPHTKVILGATCFADAEAGLQLAVTLAQHISADLHGCLVADDTILAAVALPKTRVVTYSGHRFDDVTTQAMQAAFRTDARLFQQRLLAAANMASLHAAFSEAQGQLANVMAQSGETGDLVVFGFRRPPRASEGVVVLLGDVIPDPRLLMLSAELARSRRTPLTVISDQTFHAEIKARLMENGIRECILVAHAEPADVLAYLETMRPVAVFVADDPTNTVWVKRLIDAARCPVVVPLGEPTEITPKTADAS